MFNDEFHQRLVFSEYSQISGVRKLEISRQWTGIEEEKRIYIYHWNSNRQAEWEFLNMYSWNIIPTLNPKGTNFSLTMCQFLLSKTEYLIYNIELCNYATRRAMFILQG